MKPLWLTVAEKEIGVKEVRGGENPRIIEYHKSTTLKAKEDEVPWCSSFVCWCIEQAGLTSTKSAAAKSWLNWGVKLETPREGCITILKQKVRHDDKTGTTSGYHVAFFDFINDTNRVFVTGGNQSDQVKVSSFGLANYDVEYRWPEGVK